MATRINDIADYLLRQRQQTSPLNAAMMSRTLSKDAAPIVKADTVVPDAGYYGGSATLPGNPGPPEPTPIPGASLPNNAFPSPPAGGGDLWTRMDPNMGQINPSLTITGGNNFVPSGGNMGGPQGSVYGVDPNTGQNIYNVTGSPMPGFWDSTTGKLVATAGAAGLNVLAPGSGTIAKWIADRMRANAAAKQTGTDLSHMGGTNAPKDTTPNAPAWFQPGYQLPSGIQSAISRGDYQTAYGQSPSSATANFIMDSQRYGGTPNQGGDAGHTIFYPNAGTPMGQVDETGMVSASPDRRFTGGGIDPKWVLPTQSQSNALGLSFSNNAGKYNDWLQAHNQWFYGNKAPSLANDVIAGLDPKLFPAKGG